MKSSLRSAFFAVLAVVAALSVGRADNGYCTVPAGVIVMWAGTIASLPAGWQLCDGTNGTPDLRARFIKGCTTGEASGGTGGAASVSYTPEGTNGTSTVTPLGTIAWPASVPTAANESAHTHAAGAISWPAGVPTFSGSALATHQHTYTDVVTHTHPSIQVQGGTTAATTGTHIMTSTATGGSSRAATSPESANAPAGAVATGTTAATSGGTPAGTVAWPAGVPTGASSGAGTAHTHTLSWPASVPTLTGSSSTVSAQTFTGTAATIATEPAYFKLAFIMRSY